MFYSVRPLTLPRLCGLTAALALLLPATAAADETTQLIVKREPGLSAEERADVRSDARVKYVDSLSLPDTEIVSVPEYREDSALARLNADRDVEYAEPNHLRRATADPDFGFQWALLNNGQMIGVTGTPDADMDFAEAWATSTGLGQTIAVVDSGVDATHPDLVGKVAPGGKDFVGAGDSDPADENWHGTHVAGIIAAVRNNNRGIIGAAPGAKVLPLRVLDADGEGSDADIAEAFDYAGAKGVKVVNASLGGPGLSRTLRDAIGRHPGTLYIVAAGNDGRSARDYSPCDEPQVNIVCVGASNNRDERADFSNYGETSVDLFAPGEQILSLTRVARDPADPYWYADGTSMATPFVAAEAALVLERRPDLDSAGLKSVILGSAEPKPAFEGLARMEGRANALAALTQVLGPLDDDLDGVADRADNCPVVANRDQTDSDRDRVGNACDATPYGDPVPPPPPAPADTDGDGRADSIDACPAEAAGTANGCPVPSVTSARARATKCKRGKRCKRSARVSVKLDRAATVRLTVLQKRCRRGKCRYVRVARKTVTSSTGSVRWTVRGKRGRNLARGSYRLDVSPATDAGRGATRRVSFRVR
jgi:subtilisin family serine protease